MKKIPIGISDFKKVIESNYYYIDKSILIKDILDIASETILIPRPRRFGKTLNISMLKYYFEKSEKDYSYLFKELSIWTHEEYQKYQGRYPVIFLTFKDVNSNDFELCYEHLKDVIITEYKRHRYLIDGDYLYAEDKKIFIDIINNNASREKYENSLKNLSKYLSMYYNEKVVILIDEYDTPVQQGFLRGYYNDVIDFLRNFLSGALKDNENLEKGILTGILRVAKESIFTGLNNFEVYSILKNEFSNYFGLLEDEVEDMLKYYEIDIETKDIKAWYNGYIFGENVIYNPWSMLKFVKDHNYGLIPHWINTSSNSLIKKLIITGGQLFKRDIEKLLKGESVEKVIDDNIIFGDLDNNVEAVWSFLLFTGYLKVIGKKIKNKRLWCELKIPNLEVEYFYEETIMEWFKASTTNEKMKQMLQGLVMGDILTFEYYFKQFVINTMSYFDPTGEEPERVYQAFVLGILVNLSENYYVKSNRESGLGRYDVALIPRDIGKGQKGIIFEFKKVNPVKKETIQETLAIAVLQMNEKQYEMELIDAGLQREDIIKIAVAFEGKEVLMDYTVII